MKGFLKTAPIDEVHNVAVDKIDHFLGHLELLSTSPPDAQAYSEESDDAKGGRDGDANLGAGPHKFRMHVGSGF